MAISDLAMAGAQYHPQMIGGLIGYDEDGQVCTCYWAAAIQATGVATTELWEWLTWSVHDTHVAVQKVLGDAPMHIITPDESAALVAALQSYVEDPKYGGCGTLRDWCEDGFAGFNLWLFGCQLNDDIGLPRRAIAEVFRAIGQ